MERYRDLSGNAAAMLALAHPIRLALLELLGAEGPLTATEAGELLGESAGTMSWHLRLLARHGFIVEAESGRGRRRPWALAALGTRWDPQPRTESERAAADLLSSMAVERAVAQLRAWLAGTRHRRRGSAPPQSVTGRSTSRTLKPSSCGKRSTGCSSSSPGGWNIGRSGRPERSPPVR